MRHQQLRISMSYYHDIPGGIKKQTPTGKKNLPKSKTTKLYQKRQGTAAAGTWKKPRSATNRKGCGSLCRLPRAT